MNSLFVTIFLMLRVLQPSLTIGDRYEYSEAITSYCSDLELSDVLAVIHQESLFDKNAVNKKSKDYGAMQINYRIWKNFFGIKHEKDLLEIDENIRIGCSILRIYKDKKGNKKYIDAYKNGFRNAKEFSTYHRRILQLKKRYTLLSPIWRLNNDR